MKPPPRSWRDDQDDTPLPSWNRWRAFKAALGSELRWKANRSTSDLVPIVVLGVPALVVMSLVVSTIGRLLGFQFGGDGDLIMEVMRKNALAMFLVGTFFAPPIEEFLFRVLPRALGKAIRPGAGPMWVLGVASTTIFALAHINPDNPTLPLPQFFTGLVFWAVQIRFGFLGSMALHACFNGSLLLLVIMAANVLH